MVGERTNVTGSARFRRLIEADDYKGAVEVALEQVRGGANLLDVNMDADLLDVRAGDDDVPQPASRPSRRSRGCRSWSTARAGRVLEAGLKCLQGKGVVNSISLKEGEEPFLEQARRPPLRRRRRRDGVRRAGPGRHGRAQGGDLRPRVRPARRRRLARPRTSSSTRTCSRSPQGSRSTTSSRRRSSRRCRGSRSAARA